MKKLVFLCLFVTTGIFAYSQTWAIYVDEHWDKEFTVIKKEQFDRIVNAQETTANFVILDFYDEIQATFPIVTRGTRPDLNGYYYLMIRFIPKTTAANVL